MRSSPAASPYLAPSPTIASFPPTPRTPTMRRGSAFSNSGEAGPSRSARAREDDEALDEIRRYESFSTVDWVVDSARERHRLARERQAASAHFGGFSSSSSHLANGVAGDAAWGGRFGFGRAGIPPRWWSRGPWGRRAWLVWGIVKSALSAFTDSGIVVLVGVLIGLNMGIISLATEWASDLKQGYCSSGWWLNQKFCCWEMMDQAGPGGAPLPAPAKALASATLNATIRDFSPAATWTYDLLSKGGVAALAARADQTAPVSSGDLSETCTDWVPWSHWTLPAWLIYMGFSALFAFVCAHLVRCFAPYAAGSGISEIKCILAGFVINGYLGFWTLAIKSLTLPLAIASGLSIGKEGPAVHVACCIGNVVATFFRSFNRSQAKMRELLTASSAAGVAVAFGSPIGGVLFSLEEMAYNFPASTMWRSFICALAATVTLSFMNPFRTGKLVLFQVSYDRDWHYFEILFYIVIGVFGGLYGAFIIKYNLQVQSFRRNYLARHGVSEAVLLATLTAFIGYANKFLRIDMTESLEILFRECEGGGDYDNLCQTWAQWRMVNSLLLATVLRTVLVIISYGCKVPAGIFVPSMAIGATFGRMVGILVKALYITFPHWSLFSACQPDVPCITPGTYAFLGAAAALAGVTRITVAVVVIMFELTGALTYILPTMIVVGITKGVADWFSVGGIAEQMIKFSGYPFLDKDDHTFGIPVGEAMHAQPQVLFAEGIKLSELEAKLADGNYKGFPVVLNPDDRVLLGYAGKTELRYAINKARRARTLAPDTLCLFTSVTMLDDRKGAGSREQQQSDLINMPSLPTTAASDQAQRADMLSRFGGHASATSSNARGDARRSEAQSLIGEPSLDEEDDDDHSRKSGGGNDDVLGEAGGGVDGEGDEGDVLELGGWVDHTPLIVQPQMALETVMDLFKKLGPRVILVVQFGKLSGLVTVKDVLKRIAAHERAEANARSATLPTATNVSAGGADQTATTAGGELELILKEAYDWLRDRWTTVSPHVSALQQRLGLRGARSSPRRHAMATNSSRSTGEDGGQYSHLSTQQADDADARDVIYSHEEEDEHSSNHRSHENPRHQFVVGDED